MGSIMSLAWLEETVASFFCKIFLISTIAFRRFLGLGSLSSFNNSYLSALQNQPTGAVSHRQSSMPSTRSHYKDPFQ